MVPVSFPTRVLTRYSVTCLPVLNVLQNSFAVLVEIFYHHLCGLAVGADRKSDAAYTDSILTSSLVGECVAVVVFHREGEFLRTLHNR